LDANAQQEMQRFLYQKQTQGIRQGIQPRLEQLTERGRKVAVLLANKQKAAMIRKVFLGLSGLGGASSLATYLLHRKAAKAIGD
jgi:hypothetical protein